MWQRHRHIKLLCLIENLKEKEWKGDVLPKGQVSTNQKHGSFPVSIFTLHFGEELSANFHINMNVTLNFVVRRIFKIYPQRYSSLIHRTCEYDEISFLWIYYNNMVSCTVNLETGRLSGWAWSKHINFLKHRAFSGWRQTCQRSLKCEKNSAQGCCFKDGEIV